MISNRLIDAGECLIVVRVKIDSISSAVRNRVRSRSTRATISWHGVKSKLMGIAESSTAKSPLLISQLTHVHQEEI